MFHRSRTISILVVVGLGWACTSDPSTGVIAPSAPTYAKAQSIPDSKARYTFHNTMLDGTTATGVRGDNRLADGSSADGGSSVYQGGLCGVHGKIFWYDKSLSQSGDAVFDPDKDRAACGSARKLNIAPFGAVGPSMNFAAIMQLVAGEARSQQFGMTIGVKGCERLVYSAEVESSVRVTRISGNSTDALGTWEAVSEVNHRAGCYNFVGGSYRYNGVSYVLPLHVSIEEIR